MKNPDYQKEYKTNRKKSKVKRQQILSNHSQTGSRIIISDKKEQLTSEKSGYNNSNNFSDHDKKEQLNYSYYMIKAKDIQMISLTPVSFRDKKE